MNVAKRFIISKKFMRFCGGTLMTSQFETHLKGLGPAAEGTAQGDDKKPLVWNTISIEEAICEIAIATGKPVTEIKRSLRDGLKTQTELVKKILKKKCESPAR